MEKILFQEALNLLKQGEIIISLIDNQKHFFVLKNDKIHVKTNNSNYTLKMDEFTNLFKDVDLYLYEPKNSYEISAEKDQEYYSWTHK